MTTVRINELPPLTEDLPLSLEDRMPVWVLSENKTKRVTLQDLYQFFQVGGGGPSHPPIAYGGHLLYTVSAAEAGSDSISIPSLAGQDFLIRRGGFPLIPQTDPPVANAQYEILDAGGVVLLQDGDEFVEGEILEFFIFSLLGGGGAGGGTTTTTYGSFVRGKKEVTTNLTLDVENDMNKLIQVRGASTALTITLPSVADIPVNTLIPIETIIGNTKPTTIQTTGGQNIYYNGGQSTSIVMHPSEIVWLYRDTDGFYIINDFYQVLEKVGNPIAAYKQGKNQLVCKGQLVNRADYPRLWAFANGLSGSTVNDTVWSTVDATVAGRTVPRPYRGCFSTGDGSTTFRLPDLMNMALRGVKTESGTDTERHLNKPGGFQLNEVLSHTHKLPDDIQYGGGDSGGQQGGDHVDDSFDDPSSDAYGGVETRMDNVGVLWVVNY